MHSMIAKAVNHDVDAKVIRAKSKNRVELPKGSSWITSPQPQGNLPLHDSKRLDSAKAKIDSKPGHSGISTVS